MSGTGFFEVNMTNINSGISTVSPKMFAMDNKTMMIAAFLIFMFIIGYYIYKKLIKVEEQYR